MHAVLLTTLLALGAGADAQFAGRVTQSSADIYDATSLSAGHHGGYVGDCATGNCGPKRHAEKIGGWFGHMPQTCYDPRYGCYYGGGRHMHRYPAFHGNFYRRPYVYRDVFDYPWHAEMHEPTSMFSYNVVSDVETVPPGLSPAIVPSEQGEPLPGLEAAQRVRPQTNAAVQYDARLQGLNRRAVPYGTYHRDITDPSVRPAATLRR